MFDKNPLKRNSSKVEETRESESFNRTPMPSATHERSSTGMATIGPSIFIKGELNGGEDLVIQGTVEGTINLKQNNLTIGQEGKVNANIQAHTVIVEGTLKGDVYGEEKVIIKKTGNVHGNVSAPRVSLEDGAKFKGSMDMDYKRSESAESRNDTGSASVFKLDNKASATEKPAFESKGAAN